VLRSFAGNQFANLYRLPHHKLFVPSRSPRCDSEFTNNIAIDRSAAGCAGLALRFQAATRGAGMGRSASKLRKGLGENECAGL
jgi:hypothetical protein